MRRFLCVLAATLGLGAACFAGGVSTAAAAPPAPVFGVTLTHDASCRFTATASWSHAKVTEVDFTWSFGIASWQDAVTSFHGPRGVDTFSAGASSSVRDWSVTANVYSGGSLLATVSDDDLAGCALLL